MLLHTKQKPVAASKARFKVVRAGRKSGKTTLEIEVMLYKAVAKAADLALKMAKLGKNRNVLFIAPTQIQARKIVWEALKSRVGDIGTASEQRLEMKVQTADGGWSTIYVGGWENRENYRGMADVVHITFDETDSMKDFFIGWQEIFRPMLLDTGGTADFIGTPKKENPNLKRLENEFEEKGEDFGTFHFTPFDNPYIDKRELSDAKRDMDPDTYRQEILAEYIENAGALFKYTALVDVFTNTVTKDGNKYLIVDVADDGSDKTIFNFFESLESYRIERFERLNTESIINQIREYAATERIPYSQIAVDAIGVGAGVATSSLLDGIIGYKSSYGAIRTDEDPTRLPNVHYLKHAPLVTEYRNLRSQCVFMLATRVNDHEIACRVTDLRIKESIIEELALYQDASKGDGKRLATMKEDIVALLGHSPDISDTFIMRMYFEIRQKMLPAKSEATAKLAEEMRRNFDSVEERQEMNRAD